MHKKMMTALGLCALTWAFFFGISSIHAATTHVAHISAQNTTAQSAVSLSRSDGDPDFDDDDDAPSEGVGIVINKKTNVSNNSNKHSKSVDSNKNNKAIDNSKAISNNQAPKAK